MDFKLHKTIFQPNFLVLFLAFLCKFSNLKNFDSKDTILFAHFVQLKSRIGDWMFFYMSFINILQ